MTRLTFALPIIGILLGLGMSGAPAQEIPVKEETLGPWHYLLPLELYSPNFPAPKYSRPLYAPTVVLFAEGARIAAILPGSSLVAEFRDEKFYGLKWPPLFLPQSLAIDSSGKLCCLFRKRAKAQDDYVSGPQWVTFYDDRKSRWSEPRQVPLLCDDMNFCDHIEFDSHHRLWTLGPCGKVAVLIGEKWDTYAYSNDKKLHFAPVRLKENPNGDILLFANPPENNQVSRMKGIVTFYDGKFVPHPDGDATVLVTDEKQKEAAMANDHFDRQTGYVCHIGIALNRRIDGPTTVLKTDVFTLISLANEGFVWTRNSDLEAAPTLSEQTDWNEIDDVTLAPATAPNGDLWLGRNDPPRVIHIKADKTDEFPSPLMAQKPRPSLFTLFDQLGRPWFLWAYAMAKNEAVLFDGDFHDYSNLIAALQARAADFKAGNIFVDIRENDRFGRSPCIIKTTSGQIYLGGPMFEKFTIIDGDKVLEFAPNEINPAQSDSNGGHGYNPFSNGEPQVNADGDVTTCVDDIVYRYHAGQWIKVGPYVSPPVPEISSDSVPDDPLGTQFAATNGRTFIFRGFHFYEKTDHGLAPVDTGLNPLASYPFWKGWNASPGMTQPRFDPTGRIWISSVGPYSINKPHHEQYAIWQILRNPVPAAK